MSVVWKVKKWEELKKEELYEILRLRSEIFIVEQECPYQDLDNKDIFSQHLFGKINNEIVCYTRVFLNEEPSIIGRLVVKKKFRNRGLAKPLIISSINNLIINNCEVIYLEVDNQNEPAKKIYSDLGFKKYSKLDWYAITN